jgi:GMP reductase
LRIENDLKLDFDDVLIRPKRSTLGSRKEVSLKRTFKFKHSNQKWTGIPIMASNMDGVGTIEMAHALGQMGLFTCLIKTYEADELETIPDPDKFSVSTGIKDYDLERLNKFMAKFPETKFITIDVANGYSERFGDFVSKVREKYKDKIIIAGNVVTADMTQELVLRGADIIKVGIGPGSVCTTRIQTGIGYPQLSAIIECADAAHGLGAQIISDGGCRVTADIAKAFGAGADFVMLGGMLAGHDEGGGEIITEIYKTNKVNESQGEEIYEINKFVKFYGMSSDTAMNKHAGGVASYRSSEGRTVKIPYKKSLEYTVQNMLGGLRSTCTYVGAPTLKQLSKCTTFIQVNNQYNKIFE